MTREINNGLAQFREMMLGLWKYMGDVQYDVFGVWLSLREVFMFSALAVVCVWFIKKFVMGD